MLKGRKRGNEDRKLSVSVKKTIRGTSTLVKLLLMTAVGLIFFVRVKQVSTEQQLGGLQGASTYFPITSPSTAATGAGTTPPSQGFLPTLHMMMSGSTVGTGM